MNPLESVNADLAVAFAQRAELDKKIQALQESAKILVPIYGRSAIGPAPGTFTLGDIKDLGLTRAIEQILIRVGGKPLPPTSVRNGLLEAGFELTGENPLASIHQVLKRLIARENSPFCAVEFQGQTMYKFDPPMSSAIAAFPCGTKTEKK
ncbi:MAG TPA: hypothetical protein VGR73_15350 [Bryobacteraceae bacterium]|nr:hypothetical protein [Bryobacteraceae bacterium]